MANDSHLRRSMAYSVILAVLAIVAVSAPPAPAQQAPPAQQRSQQPRGTTAGTPDVSAARHPLDPLEPAEIASAVAVIRKERQLADSVRFVTVTLKEPSKEVVRRARPGGEFPREAFVILLDKATGRGYEADVDLRAGAVRRYEALPEGVQPPIMLEEFAECEEAVAEIAGLPRGDEEAGHRGRRAWSWSMPGRPATTATSRPRTRASGWSALSAGSAPSPHDNDYARPVENIVAVVDLNRKELRPGRGLRRHPPAPPGRQLGARVHQGDAQRRQAAGDRAARGAELRRRRATR